MRVEAELAARLRKASRAIQYTLSPNDYETDTDAGQVETGCVFDERCISSQGLRKRPRVLIADDHPGLTKAIGRLLALDCEIVGTVADGSAVLEAVQQIQPDVIVVDLSLPGVSGLEICRQIAQLNPEAKIIVFSANNDPDVQQRSFEVGASAFVSKLGDSGNLLSTIKRLCDRADSDAPQR